MKRLTFHRLYGTGCYSITLHLTLLLIPVGKETFQKYYIAYLLRLNCLQLSL